MAPTVALGHVGDDSSGIVGPPEAGTLSDTQVTTGQGMVIERVSDDRLLGRALLLSIADDVAGWVAADRLASPVEREAARAHGAYLRQRMRRILGLLEGRGVEMPAACSVM